MVRPGLKPGLLTTRTCLSQYSHTPTPQPDEAMERWCKVASWLVFCHGHHFGCPGYCLWSLILYVGV